MKNLNVLGQAFVHYKTYLNLFNSCIVKKIIFEFHSSQEILFFIGLLQIVNTMRPIMRKYNNYIRRTN